MSFGLAEMSPARTCGVKTMNVDRLVEELGEALSTLTKRDETFQRIVPLIKNVRPEDERFVLGIVLEPETRDAQDDVISLQEIQKAAHKFMEDFGGRRGLMHRKDISDKVKIVETYIAPSDLLIGGVRVRKGTWLMGWRIEDGGLWSDVRTGKLTGFSIGGSARRVPES